MGIMCPDGISCQMSSLHMYMKLVKFHHSTHHYKRLGKSELIQQYLCIFTTLWVNSAGDKLIYFSYFSQKTGSDISCKLSPMETTCMKCQSLFSGQNKKNISKCRLLKFLPSMLSVYNYLTFHDKHLTM